LLPPPPLAGGDLRKRLRPEAVLFKPIKDILVRPGTSAHRELQAKRLVRKEHISRLRVSIPLQPARPAKLVSLGAR
jgi:hypothetical protein